MRRGAFRRWGAVAAFLLCATTAGHANDPPPAAIARMVPSSTLVGQGRMSWFGLALYDARVWASAALAAQSWMEQPFALELVYRRAFSGADIAKRSLDEMRRQGDIGPAQAQRWEEAMRVIFPDVAPGDRIAGVHLPGQGAAFLFNGKPAGEVKDAEFARRFFGIWLAPTTSEPSLRAALLGPR